jgi:hypothetical protein
MVIAAILLSWKASPSISGVAWIPQAVGEWFDRHDALKNFFAFGMLAFVGLMAFGAREEISLAPSRYFWPVPGRDRKLLVLFGLIALTLELGQLTLPDRTCDLADILVGWSGTLLAWPLFRVTQCSLLLLRCKRRAH